MRRILATMIGGWLALAAPRVLASELSVPTPTMDESPTWPQPTQATRPWTRWWWLGSAVDKENLSRLFESYHAAGLGGVEITCIYGVNGAEDRELPFLSETWVDALRHTVREAKRLGMGVDLPTGSGWRTGGPSVTEDDANAEVIIEQQPIEAGSRYTWTFDQAPPQALVAYGPNGQVVDLGEQIRAKASTGDMSHVSWDVPEGSWTLYTVTQKWSRDNVKRPAPGGQGKNINPLSRRSLENFLAHFGDKLDGVPQEGVRAQFHDSYEYEGNWCDEFLAEFKKRRGYKLEHHLPAFRGEGDEDEVARVKCDYRETVSDLILDNLIEPWTDWSHEHGMISRNQSHGSPANWLDLYAACDIPETESFGRLIGGDTNRLVFMFASSGAHVAGKPLVSSESATWLDEHYNETLGQVKEIVDRFFLGGVNHIFYHGTAYSPADAAWPGWLFYASTQLNPQNPIWRDFATLNEYVTRCQSVLQSTRPDNDVLLYWPIHDFWQDPRGLRKDIRVHNSREWLDGTEFGRTAESLVQRGYAVDYISDREMTKCQAVDGEIETSGKTRYRMVLVPDAKLMPLSTLEALAELVKEGSTVAFIGALPSGPPGVVTEAQLTQWNSVKKQLENGSVVLAKDWATLPANVRREQLGTPAQPLAFLRRAWDGGHVYFVKNESKEPFDGLIELSADSTAVTFMDPRSGSIGRADVDASDRIRLQLDPGQAIFVKTTSDERLSADWKYREPAGEATPLDGPWAVEFIEGGPEIPPPFTTQRLASWTELAGPEAERFAGTARYSTTFSPDVNAERYLLDLGRVAESARVELNGKPVATRIGPPYTVEIGPLSDGRNRLTIEVTNVAANRIRDLDRRGVKWRIFKDINLVNINYQPFDASNWPVRDAGLIGPVTITPLE